MNTVAMQKSELLGDAELVGLCLSGDREAFGRIVERYQSLICALAYSACGDLARSEDLAQETFIAAWRQLAALREPAKLKYWLCGILRNLISNSARAQNRNPLAAAVDLDDELTSGPEWDAPSDEAMSKEEAAILWRVLETLPASYRDPLVLFYRSGNSTAEVADTLGLSEETVRQRLARGRAMLNQRVSRLVESGLRRSNPTKIFTVGVLAALPVVTAQAGVASGAVATAKGTGALKTASGLGPMLATLSGVLPALGGFIGLWGHIENTRTRRERRFVAWTCLGLVGWMILLGIVAGLASAGGSGFGLRIDRSGVTLSNAIHLSLIWLAFAGPLDAYAIWMALRQRRIRAEDKDATQRPLEASRRGYRLSMYGSMLAMVFGTTGWLFLAAHRAQDWTTLAVLAVLGVAGWLASAGMAVKSPTTRARVMQVFVGLWWGLALVNLGVFNLRWSAWQSVLAPAAPPDLRTFLNVLICVFFGSVRAMWYLKWQLLRVPTVKRDSLIALGVYLAVMAAGVAMYKAVKVGEVPDVQATQCMIHELQLNGSSHFQSLCDFRNDAPEPLRELRFVNSDFVRVGRMSDGAGRPVPFTVEHRGRAFAYAVSLSEALPAGKTVFLRTEGIITNQVHRLADGAFEYSEQHWPANNAATLRVEILRLPAGAEVLETSPADMTQRRLPDGRVELHTQKAIPPGDSITVRIRFRLAGRRPV